MDVTRSQLDTLVRRETYRSGVKREAATQAIARRVRRSYGTITNILRQRVKRVDAALAATVQALLIDEYQREIAAMTHELDILKQCGTHPASLQVSEVETHLAAARQVIERLHSGKIQEAKNEKTLT